jgi:hypothetical protein
MYQVGFLPLDKPTRLFNHVSRIHELKLLVGIIVLNRDFTWLIRIDVSFPRKLLAHILRCTTSNWPASDAGGFVKESSMPREIFCGHSFFGGNWPSDISNPNRRTVGGSCLAISNSQILLYILSHLGLEKMAWKIEYEYLRCSCSNLRYLHVASNGNRRMQFITRMELPK